MNVIDDIDKRKFLAQSKANPELNAQFKENNRTYTTRLQVAKFTKFPEKLLADAPVVYAGVNKMNSNTVIIFGSMIPSKDSQKQEFELCVLLLIQLLEPKLEQKQNYTIVFFNTNLMTASKLNEFRTVMIQMPLKYFEFLDKIYVLHSNFLVRSGMLFSGNEMSTFIKNRIIFIDNLFELSKVKVFKYEMLQYVKEYVKSNDTSYKDIQFIRNQSLMKKKTAVFQDKTLEQIDEEEMMNFNKESKILGQPLTSYEKNHQGFVIFQNYFLIEIPTILDILIQFFTQNEQHMLEEGVFRKQGAVLEEKILEAALANHKYKYISKMKDPHVVCGVIKQFFLQLPEPIFPFSVYDLMIKQAQGKPSTHEVNLSYVKMSLASLPTQNRQIVGFICQFLARVIHFEDRNKMTAHNMAVVFGPSFFRSKNQSIQDFTYIGFFITLIEIMIQDNAKLFPDINYKECLTQNIFSKHHQSVSIDGKDEEELYQLIGFQRFSSQKCQDEDKLDQCYDKAIKEIQKEEGEAQKQKQPISSQPVQQLSHQQNLLTEIQQYKKPQSKKENENYTDSD